MAERRRKAPAARDVAGLIRSIDYSATAALERALKVAPDEQVTVQQARDAATSWLGYLDGSLRELAVDRVDAYYLMASHNPSLIASEEVHDAFERAKPWPLPAV